jgi:hypothetical protein
MFYRQPTTTGSESKQSTVQGQIERVTFYNEETDFTIARLKASVYRDLITSGRHNDSPFTRTGRAGRRRMDESSEIR